MKTIQDKISNDQSHQINLIRGNLKENCLQLKQDCLRGDTRLCKDKF